MDSGLLHREEAQEDGGGATLVFDLVVHADGCAVVTGVAFDDLHDPVRDADVGIFEATVGRRMIARERTDAMGAFRVAGLPTSEVILVVQQYGLRPRTIIVALSRGENDVGRIEMSESAAISGDLYAHVSDASMSVRVQRMPGAQEGEFFVWGQSSFRWVADQLEYNTIHAVVRDVRFRVSGLESGVTYRIASSSIGCASVRGVPGGATAEAVAPREGLELYATPPLLSVRVIDLEGKALRGARVSVLDNEGAWGCETNEEGWSRISVRARTDYEVRVTKPGYLAGLTTLRSSEESGVVEATLVLRPAENAGAIMLVPAKSMALTRVEVALEPVGHEGAAVHAIVERKGIGFRVDNIIGGAYSLLIGPMVDVAQPKGYLLPAHATIAIRPGELARHNFDMEEGGRLELRILDDEGHEIPARCTILDDSRSVVPVRFASVDTSQNLAAQSDSVPHLTRSVRGFVPVLSPLVPGNYIALAAHEGFEPIEQHFSVAQGRTIRVQIQLVPR